MVLLVDDQYVHNRLSQPLSEIGTVAFIQDKRFLHFCVNIPRHCLH